MELEDTDVVLIDGRSGSGKTSLTERLVRRQRLEGVEIQVLHVEDLYPGWDGLEAGSQSVAVALESGGYRRYDWVAGDFGDWIALTPDRPLVIEGCGAITSDNLAAAHSWARRVRETHPQSLSGRTFPIRVHAVWLESSAALRRDRALARDGETFRPYWERWAAQEDQYFAITQPASLADEIIRIE